MLDDFSLLSVNDLLWPDWTPSLIAREVVWTAWAVLNTDSKGQASYPEVRKASSSFPTSSWNPESATEDKSLASQGN